MHHVLNAIFRSSADPFAGGGMKNSTSDGFLTRVAEPPAQRDDFDLGNGLSELSSVVIQLVQCTCMFVHFTCFLLFQS